MNALANLNLNTILHQPVRTRLVAYLITKEQATFNELKQALDITDGNLDSHLKKLLAASYLKSKKQTVTKGRQQTHYQLTTKGKDEFENYVESLKQILSPQLETKKVKKSKIHKNFQGI